MAPSAVQPALADRTPRSPSAQPPPSGMTGLLISCPDRPGIVAAVSTFLHASGANIVQSDQHSTDPEGGRFFMRMVFALPPERREPLAVRFGQSVGSAFEMDWRLWHTDERQRVAVLVSRYDHCLLDLLWRWRRSELPGDIRLVASNHPDLEADVRAFDVPYHHIPVPKHGKRAAEEQLLERLAGRFDLIVLARYMQILSGEFLERVGAPVMNIHHSFLPAFAGANPYHRAREKGVKVIGATAHYVSEELDAGPIVEQDVARVSHRHDVEAVMEIGRDVERAVLARAVKWHLENRVIVHEGRTVVF